MTLSELSAQTAAQFKKTYGHPPQWIVAAPGRVNIIGEHTDYNDGFVLPMALDRATVIAAAPSGSPHAEFRSAENSVPAILDLTQPLQPLPKGQWINYAAGVMAGFQRLGEKLPGFQALVHTSVPLGGGLSSSAALEVATATLLETITGRKLDPVQKALLCQKAEHEFAGVPCGIMDQFTSVMGAKDHLLLLDCRSRQTELVPMQDPSVSVLIVNTNVKHELTGGEYAIRRSQCEAAARALGVPSLRHADMPMLEAARAKMEEVVFRRARHIITETERTVQAAQEIRASNFMRAGQLMYDSHRTMRDDFEISCAELDCLVEIARAIGMAGGVFGSRMTGGGFGGCTVSLVQTDAVDSVSQKMAAAYQQQTGIKATVFVTRPSQGATVLQG